MRLIIIFGVGVIIGSIVTLLVARIKTIGALRVDNSDEDGPYLFLELFEGVDAIKAKRYVTLKVKIKDYISRE